MSPDNLEATGFLDTVEADFPFITDRDIRGKLYDGASIEIRIVNWANLTQGELQVRKGVLGVVKMENYKYNVEIRGLTDLLRVVIGDLYGPVCRAELGDSKCKVNMANYQQSGTVSSSADALHIVPASGLVMKGSSTPTSPAPTNWFTDGIITFTSGNNNGLSFQIKGWDGTTLTLYLPLFQPAVSGDTFIILPGCNHSADPSAGDCQNKYSNIVNFRGENSIPGLNQILNYPDAPTN